ncbi:MAG: hypothetical protein QGG40_03175 [Myxococcota bacterium]|jgi:hypothetical protein|nr:hypothetical protein [Myxococcota bacterium]
MKTEATTDLMFTDMAPSLRRSRFPAAALADPWRPDASMHTQAVQRFGDRMDEATRDSLLNTVSRMEAQGQSDDAIRATVDQALAQAGIRVPPPGSAR